MRSLADVESTAEHGSRHGRLLSPVKCYFKKVQKSSRGHHSRTTRSAACRTLLAGTSTDRKLIIHRAELTLPPNNVLNHLGSSYAAATDAVLAHRTLASAGSSPANLCPTRAAVPVVVLRVDAVVATARLARRTARVGLAPSGDAVRTRPALGWHCPHGTHLVVALAAVLVIVVGVGAPLQADHLARGAEDALAANALSPPVLVVPGGALESEPSAPSNPPGCRTRRSCPCWC